MESVQKIDSEAEGQKGVPGEGGVADVDIDEFLGDLCVIDLSSANTKLLIRASLPAAGSHGDQRTRLAQ